MAIAFLSFGPTSKSFISVRSSPSIRESDFLDESDSQPERVMTDLKCRKEVCVVLLGRAAGQLETEMGKTG